MTSKEEEFISDLDAFERGYGCEKTQTAWYILSGHGDADIGSNRAIALLEERVEEGDTEAMWMLGICNEFGLETEQDTERAELLYAQSRDGKNEIGDVLVKNGFWHERGNGYLEMRRLRINIQQMLLQR